jgi:hypothetical protein
MTIPQTTIPRAALRELVEQTSRLPTIWDSEEMPFIGGDADGPNAYAELSIVLYASVFVDEYRQTYNEGTGALDTQLYGYRLLTLGVKMRSFDVGTHPADLCERVRWRLRTVSGRAIFTRAGLALVRAGGVSLYNERADAEDSPTRLIPVGTFDITFAMVVCDNPQDDDGRIIASVNGGGPIPLTVA